MNSKERRKARFKRRKAAREEKKQQRSDVLGGVCGVFTFSEMFKAGIACCTGVRWKASTQNFELHLLSGTAKRRKEVIEGRWRPGKYVSFYLTERGKLRLIDAPRVYDRQIHKLYTRRVLLPLYLPDMIHNNGASLPGKGFLFSRMQLKVDLVEHYRRYGRDGSIITMDFKQFFPSAPHAEIYARHEKLIRDAGLKQIGDLIVQTVHGDRGMPLGVEPSQAEMIALPSPIDNYFKAQLSIKGGGHYMDDYYILVPPNVDALDLLEKIIAKAEKIGLQVSRSKTHIQPLTKPFKYCKAKYTLTEGGRVIVNGNRDSMKRARRKFRFFKEEYDAGRMTIESVVMSAQGCIAYFEGYDDHGRVVKLRRLFFALFGFELRTGKHFKQEDQELCVISYISE